MHSVAHGVIRLEECLRNMARSGGGSASSNIEGSDIAAAIMIS